MLGVQAVGRFTLHVFLAGQLDLVSLLLVIDQRAVEIGFIGDIREVLGGHGLHAFIFDEGIEDPAGGLAVESANQGLALYGDFDVHLAGALQLDKERSFRARAEIDGSRDALRVHGLDLGQAAARGQHLGDNFVGGLGGGAQWKKQKSSDAECLDFHGSSTRLERFVPRANGKSNSAERSISGSAIF